MFFTCRFAAASAAIPPAPAPLSSGCESGTPAESEEEPVLCAACVLRGGEDRGGATSARIAGPSAVKVEGSLNSGLASVSTLRILDLSARPAGSARSASSSSERQSPWP